MFSPNCSRLELIYLRDPPFVHKHSTNVTRQVSPFERLVSMMRTKLPQVHPECAGGMWPVAECIPADRHSHKTCSVRGPLCCLPTLNHAQESSLASVFAVFPHQRSPLQTRQKTTSPFPSPKHTHTAILICSTQTRLRLPGIFPCARLAQVKAGDLRVLRSFWIGILSLTWTAFTWQSSSVIYLCGEVEPQRLVGLSASFFNSRAGPRASSRAHAKTGSEFRLRLLSMKVLPCYLASPSGHKCVLIVRI